ncbi:MAG: hypothetical protein H7259_10645 [Cytophagales bacterium]|nr:hypothetical protein [Cytophaga sp.]
MKSFFPLTVIFLVISAFLIHRLLSENIPFDFDLDRFLSLGNFFKYLIIYFLISIVITKIKFMYDYFFRFTTGLIINNKNIDSQNNKLYSVKVDLINTTIEILSNDKESLSIGQNVKLNKELKLVTKSDLANTFIISFFWIGIISMIIAKI